MTTLFHIRLAHASTPDLVQRLRTLGEDLHRALGELGQVDMKQVDGATESFSVEVPSERHPGDVVSDHEEGVGAQFS